MPIDNILFQSDFMLDIDVTHSGEVSNVLFNGGEMLNIDVTHSGSASSILYTGDMMETVTLESGNTYSRSRVVNR